MAPKKNAFFCYMLDYQQKEKRRGHNIPFNKLATVASPSWQTLKPEEKQIYEKKAKELNDGNKGKPNVPQKPREKYNSQGVPLSFIEKEIQEKEAKKRYKDDRIQRIVQDAFLDNVIGTQPFFFIMANYFVVTEDGNFIPAELAVIKFNFIDGVLNKYHTYLNPGSVPLGYAFTAKDHSAKTHRLPCPPKALGEVDFESVYFRIKDFISSEVRTNEKPTVFTKEDAIPMIESVMGNLSHSYSDEFDIFPVEEIFFALKQECGKYGIKGETNVKNIHIAKRLLEFDPFENRPEIACEFHIQQDATKYCAMSYGMRWAYMFADHICEELDIKLIPGKHLPHNADVDWKPSKREPLQQETEGAYADSVLDGASTLMSGGDDEDEMDGAEWQQWNKGKKKNQRGVLDPRSFDILPNRAGRSDQNAWV